MVWEPPFLGIALNQYREYVESGKANADMLFATTLKYSIKIQE
jgi:hypothetical protein